MLSKWRRRVEVDSDAHPAVRREEQSELKRLKRGNAEWPRAIEILRTATLPGTWPDGLSETVDG